MFNASPPAEIAILIYPGAQQTAIHGLTDLFGEASRIAGEAAGDRLPRLRITHWLPDQAATSVACVFDSLPGSANRPAVVIVPPSLGALPDPAVIRRLAAWLTRRHDDGGILASVCAGAFLLAETGLLDGRPATTHWGLAEELGTRFPAIRIEADKLIVEDGDIITAAGVMAWTDLGLKLVDRLISPSVMMATARFLLVDPPGREQRYYSKFSPRLGHGDAAILKVQHWLQAQGAQGIDLTRMAAQAGLEERTFLRRFHRATGLKPTEYCQHLRVAKARELLELTTRPIDQIAFAAGYEDAGAFRKVFHKLVGLSPGDYRRRFGGVGAG
jgi:transcriptional regulator GlxA family with amidase domain